MDELTLRKLGLLKAFFKHGVKHSEVDSKLDNMLTIHHFDLCNEFLLRILADELKINVDRLVTLENIFDCISKNPDKTKHVNLKFKTEVLRIRKLRNDVQHNAETKTHDDVQTSYVYTKDFVERTVKEVFNIEFDHINLVRLIAEEQFREDMLKAFTLMGGKKYPEALFLINQCFMGRLTKLREDGYIPSTYDLLGFTSSFSQQYDIRPDNIGILHLSNPNIDLEQLKEAVEKNSESIKKIADKVLELVDRKFEEYTQGIMYEVSILGLGINYAEYSRYKNIIWHSSYHGKLNEEDTQFCFDFVTEFLIRPLINMKATSEITHRQMILF